MKVYLARQPIFTRDKKIHAYELLFRDGMDNFFPNIDGTSATSRVLASTFFSSDIERVTGGKRVFINFTSELILQRVPLILPPEITTVEVLEGVVPDAQLIDRLKELSEKGYQIALDDFEQGTGLDELISLCDIIKIDFLKTPRHRIKDMLDGLSGRNIRFLAEKIETSDELSWAYDAGFSLFQGYFFSRPEVMNETEIPTLKMNLLEIMSAAGNDNYRIGELERLIERDVGISYKLLRYLNSPYFRRRSEISSIRHAIVLLGEKGIKGFLSVIIMAELSQDKPDELLRSSVIRAKLCENIGLLKGKGADPAELFTLGLFSLIDAILDSPMKTIMQKLPLSQDIKSALLKTDSHLSGYLDLAKGYERGNWKQVFSGAARLGVDAAALPEIYLDALSFADALLEAARV